MASDARNVFSMTGFARVGGTAPRLRWTWEVRSVNGKGLDVRLRLPPTFDMLEPKARAVLAAGLTRGVCHASLAVEREARSPTLRINGELIASVLTALAAEPRATGLAPPTMDGLLALPGAVEVVAEENDAGFGEALQAAICVGLEEAVQGVRDMRRTEGGLLAAVLDERLARIDALASAADAAPARAPEAVRARLSAALATLTAGSPALDPERLHQEAVLLAAKADIREEIDRLHAHAAAARQLLQSGGPIGRRLDFLAQEFGREANTLCAKANHISLTAIGLDLKTEIEQFREQIQNIE